MLIPFDPAAFRLAYGQFANVQCFPDAQLQAWWDIATTTISAQDNACYALNGASRVSALNMLTAHMGALFDMAKKGETPGVLRSATIDKVSVTVEPPPAESAFQWWLGLTPYGQTLLAMLTVAGVGGFYVGGIPERTAYRRWAGGFGGIPPRRGC